ncbi:AbrB family transcriptional regulator [Roseinatronobacter sp.]|uniref:AbrB family transcriptional regulator n=1 Tax=Roseinatronobacter sp. TaxID=1945755 RepID=UPI0025CB843F|nr:AbrB family transcriptional regulator [Roseibaca sp.]
MVRPIPDISARQRPSWVWLAPSYAFAALVGYGATFLGVPLPWMIGPFVVFALLSVGGVSATLVPHGRELAQVSIGLVIGLRFTAPVIAATFALLPQMIGAAIYLLVATTLAALLFRKLAGVDPVTAFFATAAGGVADMAHVAQSYGGAPTSVAVVHALRVSLVVAIAPLVALGVAERPDHIPVVQDVNPLALMGGFVFAYLVARALKPTALPNPWFIGPILGGALLAVAGLDMIVVPFWLIAAAQVVLGVWLGCQFKRELLSALPRVTASGVATGLFLIGAALLGAVMLSSVSELSFLTAFLSLVPASVAEMVLIAKFMNLDAEIIATFHVMRILVVSTTLLWVYRIYLKLGRFSNEP